MIAPCDVVDVVHDRGPDGQQLELLAIRSTELGGVALRFTSWRDPSGAEVVTAQTAHPGTAVAHVVYVKKGEAQ